MAEIKDKTGFPGVETIGPIQWNPLNHAEWHRTTFKTRTLSPVSRVRGGELGSPLRLPAHHDRSGPAEGRSDGKRVGSTRVALGSPRPSGPS
jgi:hypothetical protein